MGKTFTVTHTGLTAAFKESRSILSHRLPFLGQLSLSEGDNVWQLGASRHT